MSFKSFIGSWANSELARVRGQLADEKVIHRQLGVKYAAVRVEVKELQGKLATAELAVNASRAARIPLEDENGRLRRELVEAEGLAANYRDVGIERLNTIDELSARIRELEGLL